MRNTPISHHILHCDASPFYVPFFKLYWSYKLSSTKAAVPEPQGEKGELPCYVPSLLRSTMTPISMALKDKNILLSLVSVLPLRSLSWGFCLPWKTKRFGCLEGPGSSLVPWPEHRHALARDAGSHAIPHHGSDLPAPLSPLTVSLLEAGKAQAAGIWWNSSFMTGSKPAKCVKQNII